MGPIRLDEHSTNSSMNEVYSMQPGEVFSVAPEFMDKFIANIPEDKYFKFAPIVDGSAEFKKYGENHFKVLVNEKTFNF